MTTTTLQKKRKPNRGPGLLRLLTSVWALLIAFGTFQSANAQQVSFSSDAIGLTLKTTTGAVQSINYAGKANANASPYNSYPKMGIGAGSTTNLGTFDLVNTSQLTLTGGSLVLRTLTDDDGNPYTVTGAGMRYRVYLKSTTTTLPAFTTVTFPTSTAYTPPVGGMQYSGSANANLLSGLSLGGEYALEVQFIASTANATVNPSDADPSTASYQLNFTVTAPPLPTLLGTAVYITPYSGGNASPRITYTVNSTATPRFQGANLGDMTYDLNTGLLLLNGGAAVTTEAGTRTINSVSMYYRVRPQGQGGGQFTAINLTQNGNVSNDGTRNFSVTNRTINLISSATISGSYSIDVYYQAGGTNSSDPANPVAFSLTDDNNGAFYTASFTVTGNPIPSTVWRGGLNDNWFDDANWSNNVPTAGTNVVIANLGTNSPNPYPRILCNTTYTYVNASTQVSTTIDNRGKTVAVARNLQMAGNNQGDRSILSLVVGRLEVGGDFDNRYDSFNASDNTVTAFVGTNQSISGGTFSSIVVDGGGVKSVQGVMNVTADINFLNGLLTTDITQPVTSVVNLADRDNINNNQGGRLMGEKDASYLQGFVRITRGTVIPGTEDLFGNIGLGLNFTTNPGQITVTRNTAQAYSPGNGAASGVRRIFEVIQPVANSGATIQANMRFFYLDSETRNLGAGGNINIDENNLVVFSTTNKGNTFTNLGITGSPDVTNNIVTLNGTTAFAVPTTTFTLGDSTNPLPVELVAFDAKRSGSNTLVTWQTASEKNNAGFDVEVAADGVKFRKLTFVASKSANSTANATYSYTDTEAGKSGVRYYRLRQVDLDGQYSYSPTRAVSFAGTTDAAVASLSSYPSPFTNGDQAALVLQAPSAGTAQLQLTDLTGRTITNRAITTVAGVSEIAVPNASELAVGIYLVKVTFATGEVKTLRIQKH